MKKDLAYWKKRLIDHLKGGSVKKSVKFAVRMAKGKAYPVGTVREWRGKKYKKMPNNSWQRFYGEAEGRGYSQAVRNTMKKIQNASSMEELVDIVKNNRSRFMQDGKMAPVVKELISAARGTNAGVKVKKNPEKNIEPEKMAYSEYIQEMKGSGKSESELSKEWHDAILSHVKAGGNVRQSQLYFMENDVRNKIIKEYKKRNPQQKKKKGNHGGHKRKVCSPWKW